MSDTLDVEGVIEFLGAIERLRTDLPNAVQVAMSDMADTVVGKAQPRIPILTGAARRSVRVETAGPTSSVVGGGTTAPYFLIIGGGKVISDVFVGTSSEAGDIVGKAIADVFDRAGLEIS